MARIILISCSKQKLAYTAPASELYASPLFKLSLALAQKLKPDAIYVLSALHGLVPLDRALSPYDLTLSAMATSARKSWAESVLSQLNAVSDPENDTYVFLAGTAYAEGLAPHLKHYELPLQGLGLGKRLAFLKTRI